MSGYLYLAGPIDGVSREEATYWQPQVMQELGDDLGYYVPASAFRLNPGVLDAEECEAVIAVNRMALMNATAVIARCSGPSWGTPIECEWARADDIPVYCFGGPSASLFRHRYTCWEYTLEEALDRFKADRREAAAIQW